MVEPQRPLGDNQLQIVTPWSLLSELALARRSLKTTYLGLTDQMAIERAKIYNQGPADGFD